MKNGDELPRFQVCLASALKSLPQPSLGLGRSAPASQKYLYYITDINCGLLTCT